MTRESIQSVLELHGLTNLAVVRNGVIVCLVFAPLHNFFLVKVWRRAS